MNDFKLYIKAYDLNDDRYKILQNGVKYLYSYLRQEIKYTNQTLNHNNFNEALITY